MIYILKDYFGSIEYALLGGHVWNRDRRLLQ